MHAAPRIQFDRHHVRQRGMIYLVAMTTSMVVVVLGASAILAARLQSRSAEAANQTLQAQHAAASAIEVARLRLAANPSWRSAYTHDAWVSDIASNGGTLTFKLVDEADANLANNASQPVRLYGKGTFNGAVRIVSVQLTPDFTGKMLPVAGTWRQEVLP
jgi:type II secretory pathway component PulK